MNHKWMTVKDVAEYLQVSEESIYKLAQRRRWGSSRGGIRLGIRNSGPGEGVVEVSIQRYPEAFTGATFIK